MRKTVKSATVALSLATLFSGAALMPQLATAADTASVEKGKQIAWDRKKGNCLACHMMPGANLPGDIGPPMIAMKARFPDRQKLYDQIYDATVTNPSTRMPPFGRYGIVSSDEINAIVDYLYTL